MQALILRRMQGQDLRQTLVTIGLSVVMADVFMWIWGGDTYQFDAPEWMSGRMPIPFGGFYPTFRILVLGAAIAIGIGLWWLFRSKRYFGRDDSPLREVDGVAWFPTGDVATIDPDCTMQIADRSKDVIKSGGEWISSIELENIAMSHPDVAEAAAIACAHPKWDERPLLVVVKKPGQDLTREELLAFYEGKIAKWQIPDDVAFVDELPHTATGKLLKTKLREQFKGHVLPGV